jgi:DNA invertase Pin-like site-specific DNA recombinase
MSRALAWIRKSKGSDDDIGLEYQRERVLDLATTLAGDVEMLDLGVQTGFSSMTRDGEGLLDHHEEVQRRVDQLASGRFDYLVAYDDRRICRDDYFAVIKYAARRGDCTFAYVGEVAEDDLTHDIKRRIERDTKEEEIEKARAAIQAKKERGEPLGPAPFGLRHNRAKTDYAVDDEKWAILARVFELLGDGVPYREIATETGISTGAISKINARGRAFYESYGQMKFE